MHPATVPARQHCGFGRPPASRRRKSESRPGATATPTATCVNGTSCGHPDLEADRNVRVRPELRPRRTGAYRAGHRVVPEGRLFADIGEVAVPSTGERIRWSTGVSLDDIASLGGEPCRARGARSRRAANDRRRESESLPESCTRCAKPTPCRTAAWSRRS